MGVEAVVAATPEVTGDEGPAAGGAGGGGGGVAEGAVVCGAGATAAEDEGAAWEVATSPAFVAACRG